MAQVFSIKYLGTVRVTANTDYTSGSILTTFPTATVAELCTDIPGDRVGISIDGYPMCHFHDDEEQYIESGQTFVFNKDCTLKIGIYKAIA